MGLFDCKSILNVILASIVAFYVIRDYKSRKVDIFSIGATTTINAETAHKKLIEHNKIWNGTSEIIQVTDGIYVGIGFSLANVIIIETNQSLIIIHTTESISDFLLVDKDYYIKFVHCIKEVTLRCRRSTLIRNVSLVVSDLLQSVVYPHATIMCLK
eukprot:477046_1